MVQVNFPSYGTITVSLSTVADLTTFPPRNLVEGLHAIVSGQDTVGDGQGGIFTWNGRSIIDADGVSIVAMQSLTTGRWIKTVRSIVGPVGDMGPVGPKGDIGPVDLALRTTLGTTSGAANVGYADNLTFSSASVGYHLKSLKKRVICVSDYGAVGDGITDDTAAIMSAIEAAHAQGGAGVMLPAGYFLVNSGSVFLEHAYSNILLYSNAPGGTTIVTGSARPAYAWGNASTQIYGGGVRGITFASAATVNGGTGLSIQNVGQFRIDDLKFHNYPGKLTEGAKLVGCSQFQFTRNEAQACYIGFEFESCIDGYLVSNRSDNNDYLGYFYNGSQGMYTINCTGYYNGGTPWKLSSSDPSSLPNMNNFFVNCVGDTSGSYNWIIDDSINSTWTNCWGSTQTSETANTYASGFLISGIHSRNLMFVNCMALFNNSHGMQIYDSGGNAPSYIYVKQCVFGSEGFAGANGNGRSGAGYGISINGACDHIRVDGGQFMLNNSGAIQNTSTGSDIIIDGNPVGYRTSNQGSSSIVSGSASTTITHGLGFTPTLANISLIDNASRSAAGLSSVWVSSVTATTFTVTANANATQTFDFSWQARASGT